MLDTLLQTQLEAATSRPIARWSAAPTPLTDSLEIDPASVRRMIDHHITLEYDGIMLAGTCGEGPWLNRADTETLVRTGLDQAGSQLNVAVQVTDNSPRQILERLEKAAEWGAHFGVVAQPYFQLNVTPARLRDFYLEIWNRSPLPLFFYDRGTFATTSVPIEILEEITTHPTVRGIKDSSADPKRFAIFETARRQKPDLLILNGDEFRVLDSLRAGFDGSFLGGAAVSGRAVRRVADLFLAGQLDEAAQADEATRQALFALYGGPKISCWLAGLKYTLTCLGIFNGWANTLGYTLSDECRRNIDQLVLEADWLKPDSTL